MAAGLEAALHGGEVDRVVSRVDEHVDAGELVGQARARVGAARLGLAAAVVVGHPLGALEIDVEQRQALGLLRFGQVADDRRGDRPAGSEHGHLHETSSFARSASHSSTRSCARLRSRPVSSSIRLIR